MQFYLTVDNDNILRIEEEEGAQATAYMRGDKAELISISVPEESRRGGIGGELLDTMQKAAANRGVIQMEVDFEDTLTDLSGLLENRGFTLDNGAPIISINLKKLLDSKRVQKVLESDMSGFRFVSLWELQITQQESINYIFSTPKIPLVLAELSRYQQDMSGVVYDKKGKVVSIILCSERSYDIHVDFLDTAAGSHAAYSLAALYGMINEVIEQGGADRYDSLTFYATQESIRNSIDRLVGDDGFEEIAKIIFASKDISGMAEHVDMIEDLSGEETESWHDEVAEVPYQDNISFKSIWWRNKKLHVRPKDEHGNDIPMTEEEKKEKEQKPHKRRDHFHVEIGFTEEDEMPTDAGEDVCRIGAPNLIKYLNILDKDAIWNLSRPYYFGLATEISDEAPEVSWLVYELNSAYSEGSSSTIRWMHLADESGAKRLFAAYRREIEKENIVTDSFELPLLPEETKALLEGFGYEITERESHTVVVTAADMPTIPNYQDEIPEYIRGLNTIGLHAYKKGVANCMSYDYKGLLGDLEYLPMEWFDREVSSVAVHDGKITGMLLLHQVPSGNLATDLFFAYGDTIKEDALAMMHLSAKNIFERYPAELKLHIQRENDQVIELVKWLFPGKEGETVSYGKRKLS